MVTTLNYVKQGQRCKIVTVKGSGPIFRRLLEMGLIEETQLEVVRYAPLGDPIEIKVHGYHLSLRKAEAAMIEVANA